MPRPVGSSTSIALMTCSTSATLSTCRGRRCSVRGSSNSEAGLNKRWYWRVSHWKNMRTEISRLCCVWNDSGVPLSRRR